MKYKNLLLCLFIVFSFGASAADKLSVAWDCYIPTNPVSCNELKVDFLEKNHLELQPKEEAFFSVAIRDLNMNNTIEYQITAVQKHGNLVNPIHLPLNSSLSISEQTTKILEMLKNVADGYRIIANTPITESDDSAAKPFYVNPTLTGSGNKVQGSQSFSTAGDIYANLSSDSWRFVGDLGQGYSYNAQDKTAFNSEVTSRISKTGVYGMIYRSISEHFGIAFIGLHNVVRSQTDPGDPTGLPANSLDNTASKNQIRAGVEWVLIPFITSESSGNISIRYSISGEVQKYVDPQTFELVQEQFARHTVDLYLAKHFKKVDVSFTGSGYMSSLRPQRLSGAIGSGTVFYKVTDRLSLLGNLSVEYARNRVMSPAEGSNTFSGLTGGNKNATSGTMSIGLKYTLGNLRLYNTDERWKH